MCGVLKVDLECCRRGEEGCRVGAGGGGGAIEKWSKTGCMVMSEHYHSFINTVLGYYKLLSAVTDP